MGFIYKAEASEKDDTVWKQRKSVVLALLQHLALSLKQTRKLLYDQSVWYNYDEQLSGVCCLDTETLDFKTN
ncbi:hypothetical protein T4D_2731 [Trichinella pseudospiralis]|uniref:Uncharacterized protein n=1 Tax=Trichinella pseudospiralis TaxID=6337 RepID=A0A0V1G4N5_TRIPS|nr:hypothetical protein T4D_2731 [Trichinella pseudospiralis]